ncbi:hypothetical protein [Enterococcus faecalis]|uniref:hypothetical protein n=1 Tax=Enterococcus faecalis TaxID=1351 RepID=UPI003BB91353
MGEELQDTIIKYNKTIAEMEQSVNDLYSDPHVFSVRYEEVQNDSKVVIWLLIYLNMMNYLIYH